MGSVVFDTSLFGEKRFYYGWSNRVNRCLNSFCHRVSRKRTHLGNTPLVRIKSLSRALNVEILVRIGSCQHEFALKRQRINQGKAEVSRWHWVGVPLV